MVVTVQDLCLLKFFLSVSEVWLWQKVSDARETSSETTFGLPKLDWTYVEEAASISAYVCLILGTSERCAGVLSGGVCISLSLRGFSLHLEALPVGRVFLCQGWGRGDEVAERQQAECGGRRARQTKRLKGREEPLIPETEECIILLHLIINIIFIIFNILTHYLAPAHHTKVCIKQLLSYVLVLLFALVFLLLKPIFCWVL